MADVISKELSGVAKSWRAISEAFAERVRDPAEEALLSAKANLRLLRYYVPRPAAPERKTKFILFGLMRSGTTLLGDLLARQPAVTWLGEAYQQRAYFPVRHVNAIARATPAACVGLKAFAYQLSTRTNFSKDYDQSDVDRARRILEKFQAQNWKFIHLTRTDTFAQTVSLMRAMHTAVWHRTEEGVQGGHGIRLEPSEFSLHLEFLLRWRRYEQSVFSGFDVLRFNYEADLESVEKHGATAAKAFSYLGLPPIPVSTDMKKIAGERLNTQVENFEEIARAAESLGVSATS